MLILLRLKKRIQKTIPVCNGYQFVMDTSNRIRIDSGNRVCIDSRDWVCMDSGNRAWNGYNDLVCNGLEESRL